jgi:hypothetical protein
VAPATPAGPIDNSIPDAGADGAPDEPCSGWGAVISVIHMSVKNITMAQTARRERERESCMFPGVMNKAAQEMAANNHAWLGDPACAKEACGNTKKVRDPHRWQPFCHGARGFIDNIHVCPRNPRHHLPNWLGLITSPLTHRQVA